MLLWKFVGVFTHNRNITCMHGSAMQSGKGVLAGKGKTPIFIPSPHKNPLPDLDETQPN